MKRSINYNYTNQSRYSFYTSANSPPSDFYVCRADKEFILPDLTRVTIFYLVNITYNIRIIKNINSPLSYK